MSTCLRLLALITDNETPNERDCQADSHFYVTCDLTQSKNCVWNDGPFTNFRNIFNSERVAEDNNNLVTGSSAQVTTIYIQYTVVRLLPSIMFIGSIITWYQERVSQH